MQKRTIALLLTVLLSLSMFSLSAMAAGGEISGSGIANSGTASITGSGFAAGDYVVRVVNDNTSPSYVICMFNATVDSTDSTGAIVANPITVGALAEGSYKIYVNNMSGTNVATGILNITPSSAPGDTYKLTVEMGLGGSARIGSSGTTIVGDYASGATATISATANTGYSFYNWTVTSGSLNLSSTQATTNPLSFEMPASDVTIRANFTYSGGSGGGGGGGGGSSTTPSKEDPEKDKDKTTTGTATESRVAGYSQIDTAISLSQKGWPEKADAVVLSYAYSFPDALAAASLAYKENAPILLTDNTTITASTLAEIQRLNPSKVILVGGTAVLSAELESSLQANYQVTRYAGIDRYATAAQVADAVGSTGKAVVVSGEVYHDALVISSYAASQGMPILFTTRDELPEVTSAALSRLNITQTIVAGGTGVVGSTVYAGLPSPTRYAGYDCYETATVVANAKELKMNLENVYVVTGANFPDALVAGNVAARTLSPLIMVDGKTSLPAVTETFFKTNKAAVKGITVVGGTAVVPAVQVNAILSILNN